MSIINFRSPKISEITVYYYYYYYYYYCYYYYYYYYQEEKDKEKREGGGGGALLTPPLLDCRPDFAFKSIFGGGDYCEFYIIATRGEQVVNRIPQ